MVDLWMLPLSVPTLNKPCWHCGTKVAECIQWAVLERGANIYIYINIHGLGTMSQWH